jgi:hypothetical protein
MFIPICFTCGGSKEASADRSTGALREEHAMGSAADFFVGIGAGKQKNCSRIVLLDGLS